MTASPPYAAHAWHGHAGLAAVEEEWDEVLAESNVNPFFNSHAWARDYAAAFVPDGDVFGWTLLDSTGAPAATLAFRAEPPRGSFALRRATFLVDGSFDCDYLDLVHREDQIEGVLASTLDLLSARRGLHAVVLSSIPNDSPTLAGLRKLLKRRRLPSRELSIPCCAATLPASFEEYVAALKPRMRSKVRSAMRRGGENGAECHWCDEPSLLGLHLEALYDLHRRRWEIAGEAGSFGDARRRKLYETSMPRLLSEGRLRLSRLALDRENVAYQLGVVENGQYHQLQEGYDPDVKDLRIGIALRGWSIARLIEEGVHTYDFLAGVTPHKTDWAATSRPTTTIAFALPRWRSRVAYGLREMLDRFRTADPVS